MNFPVAADEIDDRIVEGVKVSFYTRPIASGSSIEVSGNHEKDIATACPEYKRHWAVTFYFPNSRRWITHEATLIEGKLVWNCSQMPPFKVAGCKLYKNIATIKISPKRLHDIAKTIEINNLPYNLAFRNCQEWIKLFAKKVGGDLWHYINSNFKTYFNMHPFFATIVGSILTVHQNVINQNGGQCEDNYVPLDIYHPLFEYEGFENRVVENVQVSFYTKPLRASITTVSVNYDDYVCSRLTCDRQWVLAFHFPDSGQYVTYETKLSNERLKWLSTQMPPVKVNGGKLYKNIATCKISPNQLRQWTKQIQNNTTSLPYEADYKNSQLWIKRLAMKIGGDVWSYFVNISDNV